MSSSFRVMSIRSASQSRGMSSRTAAVTSTCSADAAAAANASPARGVQFGEDVVEQAAPGRCPRRAAIHTPPSRSANAIDHDSPWLAKPFAGCSPSRSSRSSRCGPTRHTPRSSSASRRVGHFFQQRRPQNIDVRPVGFDLDAGVIRDRRGPRRRRQQLVTLLHLGRQLVHQRHPGGHQLRAVGRQMPVPHVEGVQRATVAAESGAGRRFQQGGALAQDLVVIGPDAGHPRATHGGQIVEVSPAIAGISPDQRQVFGREQHRTQHPDYFARAAYRRAVESRLVGPARR